MKTDLQITLDNLKIVLEELPKLAEQLPEIESEFNMSIYGCYSSNTKIDTSANICKTRGCLLGNMARVLPITDECYSDDYSDEENIFDYKKFGLLHFPDIYNDKKLSLDKRHYKWEFLFSDDWSDYQPSFEQAIERLKYFIDCEGKIGDWEYRNESFIKE